MQVDHPAAEAAAIEALKRTSGTRQHTYSVAIVLGSEVLVVTEARLGMRYRTTGSGRGPVFPIEYRCTWYPIATLPDPAIKQPTSEADAKGG